MGRSELYKQLKTNKKYWILVIVTLASLALGISLIFLFGNLFLLTPVYPEYLIFTLPFVISFFVAYFFLRKVLHLPTGDEGKAQNIALFKIILLYYSIILLIGSSLSWYWWNYLFF